MNVPKIQEDRIVEYLKEGKRFDGRKPEEFRKIEEKAQFNTIVQFIKFAIVGASGTVVNLGLTYLFATVLQWNDYLATAIGFIASVLSNFILNDIWTFNPKFAKRIEAETENREKESR